MPPEVLKVTIAGTTLQVPLVEDEATTLALVEQVTQRIAKIEAHARRIDSTAFALQAAFGFAAELHHAKQQEAENTRELTMALERIAQALRDVLEGTS